MTWKVMQRNVLKDTANLHIKRLNCYTKSQHHAWMTTIFREKKNWVIREVYSLPTICSEMSVFSSYWETPVNLLVRSQNGQNLVINAWRVWSRTFIIHVNIGNIVIGEIHSVNADWECFKTLVLQEMLKTQNQNQEEFCAFCGSHSLVPMSWMCKKQTKVWCCFSEAKIIFLDANLRMDCIPAVTFWDLEIHVFHSVPNWTDGPKKKL